MGEPGVDPSQPRGMAAGWIPQWARGVREPRGTAPGLTHPEKAVCGEGDLTRRADCTRTSPGTPGGAFQSSASLTRRSSPKPCWMRLGVGMCECMRRRSSQITSTWWLVIPPTSRLRRSFDTANRSPHAVSTRRALTRSVCDGVEATTRARCRGRTLLWRVPTSRGSFNGIPTAFQARSGRLTPGRCPGGTGRHHMAWEPPGTLRVSPASPFSCPVARAIFPP